MIGDIAGILLASGDTLDVTVGQHFEMVSSPTGPVTVYGQHHAYFYVTGSTKMIDPTFLGDDFRLNP
jgi:hypothetical protein